MKQDKTSLSSNPCTYNTGAVVITHLQGPDPTLLNVVINNKLYQLSMPVITQSSPQDFSAGNHFIRNQITLDPNDEESGLILNHSQETTVSHNTITGASASIRAGGSTGLRQFPGTCYDGGGISQNRACLQLVDCNIPNFDRHPQWTCGSDPAHPTSPPPPTLTTWNTYKDIITNNTITNTKPGAPFFGIATLGNTMRIEDNTIEGGGGGAGISLGGKAVLEPTTGATIKGNHVNNFDIALSLGEMAQQTPELKFGAQISSNAFRHSRLAVQTAYGQPPPPTRPYDLNSQLSVQNIGNYWGFDCSNTCDKKLEQNQCLSSCQNTCQGFDQSKVQDVFQNRVNPLVTDSYPLGPSGEVCDCALCESCCARR